MGFKDIFLHSKKIIRISIWLGASLALLAGFSYLALQFLNRDLFLTEPKVIARGEAFVTYLEGEVYYRSSVNTYSPWKQLIVGDKLLSAFMVRTRKDSSVHINFGDQSLIRLGEYAYLKVEEFSAKEFRLDLKRGTLLGKFKKKYAKQPMEIASPIVNNTLVKDSAFKIELSPQGRRIKPKNVVITMLSGLIETVGKNIKSTDRVYLSDRQRVRAKKSGVDKVSKVSGTDNKKLARAIDEIRDREEYKIEVAVMFEPDSYEIDFDSFFALDRVVGILHKREKLQVKVKGHADSEGKAYYNDTLSLKRARAIQQYLVENGVHKDRFKIRSYGESLPVASNKTSAGRSKNRRVEFEIVLE